MTRFPSLDNEREMPQSVVAFADALGTRSSSTSRDTASRFLGRLKEATGCVSERILSIGALYNIHVRWFSDSIAMSVTFNGPSDLVGLLEDLAYIQSGYALNGIFLRGAVTTGPHYHSQYIDYGPALTEAVDLERKHAGDAIRIMLSPKLQHDLQAFGAKGLPIVEDLSDGVYFLDFLGALTPATRPEFRIQIERSYQEVNSHGNQSVIRKLDWLASYYDWRIRPRKPLGAASSAGFRQVALNGGVNDNQY